MGQEKEGRNSDWEGGVRTRMYATDLGRIVVGSAGNRDTAAGADDNSEADAVDESSTVEAGGEGIAGEEGEQEGGADGNEADDFPLETGGSASWGRRKEKPKDDANSQR